MYDTFFKEWEIVRRCPNCCGIKLNIGLHNKFIICSPLNNAIYTSKGLHSRWWQRHGIYTSAPNWASVLGHQSGSHNLARPNKARRRLHIQRDNDATRTETTMRHLETTMLHILRHWCTEGYMLRVQSSTEK